MKYKVDVGSLVTRFAGRSIIVHADSEDAAKKKAIDEYIKREYALPCASDVGTPQVDFIEEMH